MEDQEKSTELLTREIEDLRRRIAELEETETQNLRIKEALSQSVEKLRKTTGFVINVIALAVEVRDPYMAGHHKRVADLARAIASEMKLSEDVIDGIRMAGLIHDLGKISVPAEILGQPRNLTDAEYGVVKTHPEIGFQILKEIDFAGPVALIVYQHHERMDGSGYPRNLKNEEILPEAKILAVADVVEAICTHRPFRPTLGIDRALKEISQHRGILYDPEAVDVCVNLFRKKGYKFK